MEPALDRMYQLFCRLRQDYAQKQDGKMGESTINLRSATAVVMLDVMNALADSKSYSKRISKPKYWIGSRPTVDRRRLKYISKYEEVSPYKKLPHNEWVLLVFTDKGSPYELGECLGKLAVGNFRACPDVIPVDINKLCELADEDLIFLNQINIPYNYKGATKPITPLPEKEVKGDKETKYIDGESKCSVPSSGGSTPSSPLMVGAKEITLPGTTLKVIEFAPGIYAPADVKCAHLRIKLSDTQEYICYGKIEELSSKLIELTQSDREYLWNHNVLYE